MTQVIGKKAYRVRSSELKSNGPILGFSDLKFEALKQSTNRILRTCSQIMNTSFDVNWIGINTYNLCQINYAK